MPSLLSFRWRLFRIVSAVCFLTLLGGCPGGEDATPPTVSSVLPSIGSTSGSTVVTLTGSGFNGAVQVTFGGAVGTSVVVNSGTQITVTTPPRAAGAVNVVVSTATGTVTATNAYTYAAPGTISTAVGTTQGLSGDGAAATAAQLKGPQGMVFDSVGNLYFADVQNERIRAVAKITGTYFGIAMTAGNIYTLAGTTYGLSGDGAAATSARLARPYGVALDSVGNLYVTDGDNHRIRVVAKTTGTYFGVPMIAGNIYTVAGTTNGLSGDGGAATAAQINMPQGVAFDSVGNLYFADVNNHRIRVVAKTNGTYFGIAMTAGNIYTVAGTNVGTSGDGAAATAAQINNPHGVAFDSVGNLYIALYGSNSIRVVAQTTGTYFGVAMTANNIYTVVGTTQGLSGDGGAATAAQISGPLGVAFDSLGNLYFADFANRRIRVVARTTSTFYGVPMIANNIYTVAGTTQGLSGDGAAATAAQLNNPGDVAFNSAGYLYIADSNNHRIRTVLP